jgi:hypothetical protein
MERIARDVPDWLRGGNDDHLPRETAFHEQAGALGLGMARHDQKTAPVMALGVLPRPSRFASRVVGSVNEAHDRNPGYFGTRRVACERTLRKEEHRGIALLGKRNRQCFAGLLISAIQAQDAVDVSWLVCRRVDEEPESRRHKYHDDCTEAQEQSPSPKGARSCGPFGWNSVW